MRSVNKASSEPLILNYVDEGLDSLIVGLMWEGCLTLSNVFTDYIQPARILRMLRPVPAVLKCF